MTHSTVDAVSVSLKKGEVRPDIPAVIQLIETIKVGAVCKLTVDRETGNRKGPDFRVRPL
jgi:hypothetical protein